MTSPDARPPALGERDLYLYALGNGALFLLEPDGRSRLAPLPEVLDAAVRRSTSGGRVLAGWDDTPIAHDAIAQVRGRGVSLDPLADIAPPHTWDEGTDALMEAAAVGSDAILDDLLARGADRHRRDSSGSTALHHAAAGGNLHAIGALVAAGADIDARNADGFTPYRMAIATRRLDAARRLADLGADVGPAVGDAVDFPTGNLGAVYVWFVVGALGVAAAAIVALTAAPAAGLAVLLAYAAFFRFLGPPRAFWSGGAPRRLEGTTLTIRGVRGRQVVDLRAVTAAAIGGGTGRQAFMGARWLLLAHPDGHPVDDRSLRRLRVPPDEAEDLAARIDRVIVVAIQGGGHDAVVAAIGNVLSASGVDLSPSLRTQLARARADRRAR